MRSNAISMVFEALFLCLQICHNNLNGIFLLYETELKMQEGDEKERDKQNLFAVASGLNFISLNDVEQFVHKVNWIVALIRFHLIN